MSKANVRETIRRVRRNPQIFRRALCRRAGCLLVSDDVLDAIHDHEREEEQARGLRPDETMTDEEFDEWWKEHMD